MAVRIQLDRPHAYFTNLDFITGKVHMQIYTNETISNIVVKLEGESKTRLAIPDNEYDRRDRGRTELEVHKVSACSQELHLNPGHAFLQSSFVDAVQNVWVTQLTAQVTLIWMEPWCFGEGGLAHITGPAESHYLTEPSRRRGFIRSFS